MTCAQSPPPPFTCPSEADLRVQALALLPRGRAWRNHDGGPEIGSTLYGYFAAFASVLAFVNQRLCDLRREFWCVSQRETNDLWLAEFGLPDPCDPFADLCAKARGDGGASCAHFVEIAARAGWAITCTTPSTSCGALAGQALAGSPTAFSGGSLVAATLSIVVFLSQSPAYVQASFELPLAGRMLAGQRLTCFLPDVGSLQCLFARVLPAHLSVQFTLA